MSVRPFTQRRRHREQALLDVETGRSNREEEEEKALDSSQQFSRCPACNQWCDVLLILPCSHNMCAHCVAVGEKARLSEPRHRSAGLPVCSVLCPSCRHPVELPCWNWSLATSCLPKYPTQSPASVSRETAPGDQRQQVKDTHVYWNVWWHLAQTRICSKE